MSKLPPYSVRVSTRAKRVHMKVLPPGKIEVVVPRRFNDDAYVQRFVAANHEWLDKQLRQMETHYAGQSETISQAPLLPNEIYLAALDERWQVAYGDSKRGRLTQQSMGCLQVDADDVGVRRQLLCTWLQRHAVDALSTRLAEVSREVGLPYGRLTVRAQKSRWGSCSSQKNISLNRAMLFLSPHEVRYLLIHELCHTVHMNHSADFWALVAKLMPNFDVAEARLRQAMRTVPFWALPN